MSRKPKFHPMQSHNNLDHIKRQICEVIDWELMRSQISYKEFASLVGTTPSSVSHVTNKKVDRVSFNQLFRYLGILRPKFKILIAP